MANVTTFRRTYQHSQMINVDSNGNEKVLFPENTVEDVLLRNSSNNYYPKNATTVQDILEALGKFAFLPESYVTQRLDVQVSGYLADARAISALNKKLGNVDLSAYGDGSVSSALKLIMDLIRSGNLGSGSGGGHLTVLPTTPIHYDLESHMWEDNKQVIHVPIINENCNVDVYPGNLTREQYNAISEAGIVYGELGEGTLTLFATGTVPTIDIPILLYVTEISTEEPDTGFDDTIWFELHDRIKVMEDTVDAIDDISFDGEHLIISYTPSESEEEEIEPLADEEEIVKLETTAEQVEAFNTRLTALEEKLSNISSFGVDLQTFTVSLPEEETYSSRFAARIRAKATESETVDKTQELTTLYTRISNLELKFGNIKKLYVDETDQHAVVTY